MPEEIDEKRNLSLTILAKLLTIQTMTSNIVDLLNDSQKYEIFQHKIVESNIHQNETCQYSISNQRILEQIEFFFTNIQEKLTSQDILEK